MSAEHAMRAILVLLHIEAVTRALPEPFSGSSPSEKAERREMYILTHERAPVHSRSFRSFLLLLLLLFLPLLLLTPTGSSFNYRGNAPRCQSLYYPTVSSRRVDYSLDSPRPPLAIIARCRWNGTRIHSPVRLRHRN